MNRVNKYFCLIYSTFVFDVTKMIKNFEKILKLSVQNVPLTVIAARFMAFWSNFKSHSASQPDTVKRFKFGWERSVMQDTLPEEMALSWWRLGFRLRDFPNNSHLLLYVNLLKSMCGCLLIIRIKVYHLNSCVTGRLCLGWICTIVLEY